MLRYYLFLVDQVFLSPFGCWNNRFFSKFASALHFLLFILIKFHIYCVVNHLRENWSSLRSTVIPFLTLWFKKGNTSMIYKANLLFTRFPEINKNFRVSRVFPIRNVSMPRIGLSYLPHLFGQDPLEFIWLSLI